MGCQSACIKCTIYTNMLHKNIAEQYCVSTDTICTHKIGGQEKHACEGETDNYTQIKRETQTQRGRELHVTFQQKEHDFEKWLF